MALPIRCDIPEDFFKEENRCDYLVTKEIKELWAIQIDLLEELKRVCKKYDLEYFADSGTLIGAVRHQGYIPWDDDIDIVMKRSDYNKLIEIAPREFENPYFLQSAHSEIFPRGYARLRNSNTTVLTRYDFGKNINHGIFIDIFPLDNIPDNESVKRKWIQKIIIISKVLSAGCPGDFVTDVRWHTKIKGNIKRVISRIIVKVIGYENLIKMYEELCSKYNEINTKKISYVAYSKGKAKHIWDRDGFKFGHVVNFEFTDINIPDGYDDRLKVEYSDYMKIVRASNTHGSIIFDTRTPYVEYMKKHTEAELRETIKKINISIGR